MVLSEKRDSNPRPRPWQGRALPTELFSHFMYLLALAPYDCKIIPINKRTILLLSEKRDSNPRPRPWQGRALPTELFSQVFRSQRPALPRQAPRFVVCDAKVRIIFELASVSTKKSQKTPSVSIQTNNKKPDPPLVTHMSYFLFCKL